MRAVQLVEPGDLEGMRIVDCDDFTLNPRDVRIRIRAASLNFRDLAVVSGPLWDPNMIKNNVIPLSDGAGEVIAVGRDVTRFVVGDRVAANCYTRWISGPYLDEYYPDSLGWTSDGMLSEAITIDEGALVRVPDYFTYAEAAALPCAAVSAWSALNAHEPLSAGQTVLVQGTGGVAMFAAQLAHASGAKVLAITSSDERAKLLRDAGAASVINYTEVPDWHHAVLDLTGGRGVDKIVEIGGEETIRKSAGCIRTGGEIGVVGMVSGATGGVNLIDLMVRSILIKGTRIGPRQSLENVMAALERAQIKPKIGASFAFDDYKSAYLYMKAGKHVGKVVININDDE